MTRSRRPQEIAIDRLVLPPGTIGARRVRAAVERELARLLAETPAQEGGVVRAANVRVKPGAGPDAIGLAVARQIHGGLTAKGD